MVEDPALERRADTAAYAAAHGGRAPDPGTAPAKAIVQRQPKKKPNSSGHARYLLEPRFPKAKPYLIRLTPVTILALCGGTGRSSDAIDSYRAARKINRGAGVVKCVLELFDALAMLDTGDAIAEVRTAVVGSGIEPEGSGRNH